MTEGFYVDPADYPPISTESTSVQADDTPVEPDARRRAIRTAVQVIAAVLVAIPTAWAALAAAGVNVPPGVTAWVIGIPASLTILISAAQNALDARRNIGDQP